MSTALPHPDAHAPPAKQPLADGPVAFGITRRLDQFEPDGTRPFVRFVITETLAKDNTMELYKRALDELLAGRRHFALDFATAKYVDGKAIERLKSLSYRVLEVKGVLKFENVNDDLYTLFEMTRLTNLFDVSKAVAP